MTLKHLAVLLLIILLAGCAGQIPTAAPAPTSAAATAALQPAPGVTPAPTNTPLPTQTPLPSATATETLAPTATLDPALAAARLLGVSWLPNYDLLLSIEFPGPVKPEQYRVVVEDKEYACQGIAQQPERLVCIGQGMNVYGRVTVHIFPAGSDQPGFEGQISVPFFTD